VTYVGVDEAGKGPVLGAMVVAAVRGEPDALPPVDDSKALSGDRRAALAPAIREAADTSVVAVQPKLIDRPATDMNGLGVAAHGAAAGSVARGGDRVVCDAADPDTERFARRVDAACHIDVDVEAAHRADESDPLVAAASILAKVERDAHVDRLAAAYGPCGSGYPSDPDTQRFLDGWVRAHGELPDCARRSWETSRAALADAEQSVLAGY
jgi:ribonuclease HII